MGGTRLLRSGGPCIRLTQLAFPVSPDPLRGQQVTPNLWMLHIRTRSADKTLRLLTIKHPARQLPGTSYAV